MRPILMMFRRDTSTRLDATLVVIVGVSILVLSTFLVLDSEATLLMLFLIGAAYPLAIAYIALISYLSARILWRRDAWLVYFVGASLLFVAVITWIVSKGIVGHREQATLFVFAGIPYAIFSITVGVAMLRRVGPSNRNIS